MLGHITALVTASELQNSRFSAETSQTVSLQVGSKLDEGAGSLLPGSCVKLDGEGRGGMVGKGGRGSGRREGGGEVRGHGRREGLAEERQ